MIIAIDGPAGSGKSTVAKKVAERMSFRYLDTGAMYRAVAFRAMIDGTPLYNEEAVARIAAEEPIVFVHEGDEPFASKVFIGETDVTRGIRTPSVDDAVSHVARRRAVREAMVDQQRVLGHQGDIVVEGRDIGTVVFPDAELKIFLTASTEERVRRRAAEQSQGGHLVDPTGVRESLERRDEIDSTRAVSPLEPAHDAIEVDTTDMTIEQVVDHIAQLAEERRQ